VNSVDYLLKPIEPESLDHALDKVERWVLEVASLPGGMLNLRLRDAKHTELTVARDRAREFKARMAS
jgi:YesN/AraC family two-component response regulator